MQANEPSRAVICVAFSPNGRYVPTASEDHTARVFEAATGRELSRLAHDTCFSGIVNAEERNIIGALGNFPPTRNRLMSLAKMIRLERPLSTGKVLRAMFFRNRMPVDPFHEVSHVRYKFRAKCSSLDRYPIHEEAYGDWHHLESSGAIGEVTKDSTHALSQLSV